MASVFAIKYHKVPREEGATLFFHERTKAVEHAAILATTGNGIARRDFFVASLKVNHCVTRVRLPWVIVDPLIPPGGAAFQM